MAKKKSTVQTTTHEDGVKYHAIFTPTWRAELDCGDLDSIEDAQAAIVSEGERLGVQVTLGWHRETPDLWTATGHDGVVDTLLPIAKITRVQVAE